MRMITRVNRLSLIVLIPLAASLAFVEPRRLPLSLLAGGALAMANFRGLARGLKGLLGTDRPAGKLLFLSFFRLTIVAGIIFLLAATRTVNLIALAAGFTVVVLLVVVEGYREARRFLPPPQGPEAP
jgi:hypothetical protein